MIKFRILSLALSVFMICNNFLTYASASETIHNMDSSTEKIETDDINAEESDISEDSSIDIPLENKSTTEEEKSENTSENNTNGSTFSEVSIQKENMLKNDSSAETTAFINGQIPIDDIYFPDPIFREYVRRFDTDGVSGLSNQEIAKVDYIEISGKKNARGSVKSLKGIEYFTNLVDLRCEYNQISEIDLSNNDKLTYLYIYGNDLTYADFNQNINLRVLNVRENKFGPGNLKIKNLINLEVLDVSNTDITSIDVSIYPNLKELYCKYNNLPNIDLSCNNKLTDLDCTKSNVENIDFGNNESLTQLRISDNPNLNIDLTKFTKMKILACGGLNLTSIDLSVYPELITLICHRNNFISLDLSNNPNLYFFNCCGNRELRNLDLTGNPNLQKLYCVGIGDKTLNLSNNTKLVDTSPNLLNMFTEITLPKGDSFDLSIMNLNGSELQSLTGASVSADNVFIFDNGSSEATFTYHGVSRIFRKANSYVQIDGLNFPDLVFQKYVKESIDTNRDGVLSKKEIEAVKEIDVSGTYSSKGGVQNLKGVEYFVNLEGLYCANNEISEVDLSNNKNLMYLYIYKNNLSSLDLTENTNLRVLNVSYNNIDNNSLKINSLTNLEILNIGKTNVASFDASSYINLRKLYCFETQISNLDLSSNMKLTNIDCSFSPVSNLNLGNNESILELRISDTPIKNLDLTKFTKLEVLSCGRLGLTELDLSKYPDLMCLICYSNKFTSLDFSNNSKLVFLNCCGNRLLNNIDLKNLKNLEELYCTGTGIRSLDLSMNQKLKSTSDNLLDRINVITLPKGELFDLNIMHQNGKNFERLIGATVTPENMFKFNSGCNTATFFYRGEKITFKKNENQEINAVLKGKICSLDNGTIASVTLERDRLIFCSIPVSSDNYDGIFYIENAEPGIYDLVVTKPGNLSYKISNIEIGHNCLDLTEDPDPMIREIRLIPGDMNADDIIDYLDISVLTSYENYGLNKDAAYEPITDINCDGVINYDDLKLVRSASNYLKKSVEIAKQ